MTHSDRCRFLREHGWTIDAGCKVPDMGAVLWIERGVTTAWIAVKDGLMRIHGPNGEDMTWEQVVEWLEQKHIEPQKPTKQQKGLF